MIDKQSWEKFRETGLLWWTNRTLHLFGWAIVFDYDDSGELNDVYPAKCSFRGFSEESEDRGFRSLTSYLKDNINNIEEDLD